METVPDDVVRRIASLDVDVLDQLSLTSTSMRKMLDDQHILREIARSHALPYTGRFNELVRFSKMPPEYVLEKAIEIGDFNVTRGLLERGYLPRSAPLFLPNENILRLIVQADLRGFERLLELAIREKDVVAVVLLSDYWSPRTVRLARQTGMMEHLKQTLP